MAGPLEGIRVLEIGEGKPLSYAGKLLRDLGAEVIKVEPPGGDRLRQYGPFPDDQPNPEHSGLFIYFNGGKRGARIDIDRPAGRAALDSLLEGADLFLHSFGPLEAERVGLAPEPLLARWPRLIVAAVTPYGSTGPYANWRGYAIQAQAGSGVASRTGERDREPLTSPLDQAETQHGAVHTAVAVTLALRQRERSGRGQFVDVGVMEAVTFAVSGASLPNFAYNATPLRQRSGRRFGAGVWGLFATADGEFDVITLLDRQWRAFLDAVGSPEWGDDPRFTSVQGGVLGTMRPEHQQELVRNLEATFREYTTAEMWERMRGARVSFHPVHTVPEVVDSEQARERGFFVDAPGPHPPLRVPGAPYRLSATFSQPPAPPPALAEPGANGWIAPPPDPAAARDPEDVQPLAGVRVIDISQVWAGPLLGRYLADYGADVILIETASRPRGALASVTDPAQPLAWEGLQRNRRSVNINLQTAGGVELLRALLATSDVMLDNFAARVMPSLGLNYEDLHADFPRLVIAALSAAGRSGPWSELLSYGPSLTALFGTKSLYGYPEDRWLVEDASDLDPIAGTYGMLAILAALHHRDRTGEGQLIELAQGEAGVCGVAEAVIEYVWNGREMGPQGNQHRVLAPHGIYPCAGSDRWIAIACGSDEEWTALARAAGHGEWLERAEFAGAAARRRYRGELDAVIADWTRSHGPEALTSRLQAAGVAAMAVMDQGQIIADPQFQHRLEHVELGPQFPGERLLVGSPWHLSAASPRLRRPTPAAGQHSEEILGELLGLSEANVEQLRNEGVVA